MKKLLIALQFYPGDQCAALELARFMADLEPARREDADFLFAGRHDVTHDWQAIEQVSRKFNVATFTSSRSGIGWPAGSNDLWHALVDFLGENAEHNLSPQYEAVLTCEADCVPLARDWVSRLVGAWRARPAGAVIAGHLVSCQVPHINGNLLLSGSLSDLRKIRRLRGSPGHVGWDYYHANNFRKMGWAPIKEIVSWHAFHGWVDSTWDQLVSSGCVFFHGDKGGKALAAARSRLAHLTSPL